MTKLTFYTKPECCLCDEALVAIERVRSGREFEFEKIDVSTDRELTERYGELVPVLEIDGAKAFELGVDQRELEQRLAEMAPNGTAGVA